MLDLHRAYWNSLAWNSTTINRILAIPYDYPNGNGIEDNSGCRRLNSFASHVSALLACLMKKSHYYDDLRSPLSRPYDSACKCQILRLCCLIFPLVSLNYVIIIIVNYKSYSSIIVNLSHLCSSIPKRAANFVIFDENDDSVNLDQSWGTLELVGCPAHSSNQKNFSSLACVDCKSLYQKYLHSDATILLCCSHLEQAT